MEKLNKKSAHPQQLSIFVSIINSRLSGCTQKTNTPCSTESGRHPHRKKLAFPSSQFPVPCPVFRVRRSRQIDVNVLQYVSITMVHWKCFNSFERNKSNRFPASVMLITARSVIPDSANLLRIGKSLV
jgi:hypothetical protein